MTREQFFEALWQRYIKMAPQAERIQALFLQAGTQVVNDHVAFRTFNHPNINIKALSKHITSMGYREFDTYDFKQKKLNATAFIHPDIDAPKIFISELRSEELSVDARAIIEGLCKQIPKNAADKLEVFWAGRLWAPLAFEDYQLLQVQSEYAAWLSAHGLCANHFTINVNRLPGAANLQTVIEKVKQAGFSLNTSGGEIKGRSSDYLIQASTLADEQVMAFAANQSHKIPTCYYEFAQRFVLPSGELYQGFVAANANLIFESTDRR